MPVLWYNLFEICFFILFYIERMHIMTAQDLLIYSLMTGCGLFFLINPSVGMSRDKRTPERLRAIRMGALVAAVFGGIMMVRYFL